VSLNGSYDARVGQPEHCCIPHLLAAQARRIPDRPAILSPQQTPLTYGRLWQHVDGIARRLDALGIGRQDRVALVLPNGPEMAMAFLGVASRATCAPLNPDYHAHELAFYFQDLGVQTVILQAGLDTPARAVARAYGMRILELLPLGTLESGCCSLTGACPPQPPLQGEVQANDIALVAYSTGTTSRPKRVALSHANLCLSAHHTSAALALTEEDRCLNVMPLYHLHGLDTALLASLAAGGSVVCCPGFQASRFFPWLAEFRPTWYTALPAIHQAILAYAVLHRTLIARCPLRFIRSSSAALPTTVLRDLEEVFGAPVLEGYGLTETASQVTCNPLPPRPRKLGSVGVAAGVEVVIMDEEGRLLPTGATGEVAVRGGSVMRGYDGEPSASKTACTHGWFRTGDQGYVDADGYLFLTGRLKEIINRGGEKIAPWEVEQVLMAHPAVAQAVAFAMPDGRLGEDIAAAVVLHQHASATEPDLRQYSATRLAPFKVPRRVLIVPALPYGPIGKLQRLDMAKKLGLTGSTEGWPRAAAGDASARTPVEAVIAAIWAQLLEREHVRVDDDFFRLGGDSLLATQMMTRLREAFQVDLPVRTVFDFPTLATMAAHLDTVLWMTGRAHRDSESMGEGREDVEF
jgi:acyl-CoA synthetase (AMP-forming)/AMP-acid ligase II/acyl carrier protein